MPYDCWIFNSISHPSIDSKFQDVKYSGLTADTSHAIRQSFINSSDSTTIETIDPMLLMNNHSGHSTSSPDDVSPPTFTVGRFENNNLTERSNIGRDEEQRPHHNDDETGQDEFGEEAGENGGMGVWGDGSSSSGEDEPGNNMPEDEDMDSSYSESNADEEEEEDDDDNEEEEDNSENRSFLTEAEEAYRRHIQYESRFGFGAMGKLASIFFQNIFIMALYSPLFRGSSSKLLAMAVYSC